MHVQVHENESGELIIRIDKELSELVKEEAAHSMTGRIDEPVAELMDHIIRTYCYSPSVVVKQGWNQKEHFGRVKKD